MYTDSCNCSSNTVENGHSGGNNEASQVITGQFIRTGFCFGVVVVPACSNGVLPNVATVANGGGDGSIVVMLPLWVKLLLLLLFCGRWSGW